MKVNELREILKKYDEKDKDKIIVELYKIIPKAKKEERNIDEYISDINKNVEKEVRNSNLPIDVLEKQIDYFCECAMSDLYASPNRVIPKTERSKWRFRVRAFYKQLNRFLPETEDGKKATMLLKDLFSVLSYGTHYLIFPSWNTFGAIQVSQVDFLACIMGRVLINGVTIENLKICVECLNVKYDPTIFHDSLFDVFSSFLHTPDTRKLAIKLLEEKVEILKGNYIKNNSYENKERLNSFVRCILNIYIDLYEPQVGIKYFLKEYNERDLEVKEYYLLDVLEGAELYTEWVAEYENKVKKVDFRESLKEKYNVIKKQV